MLEGANFKMADKPKMETKEPKRFCNEHAAYTPVKKANPRKKDTKLYDIEVTEVDKANKKIQIHHIGYSTRFDELRPFPTLLEVHLITFRHTY